MVKNQLPWAQIWLLETLDRYPEALNWLAETKYRLPEAHDQLPKPLNRIIVAKNSPWSLKSTFRGLKFTPRCPTLTPRSSKLTPREPKPTLSGQNSVNCPYPLILGVDVKKMSKSRSFWSKSQRFFKKFNWKLLCKVCFENNWNPYLNSLGKYNIKSRYESTKIL